MSATAYYSPSGNPEVWEVKPDGYYTEDEWYAAHPTPIPPPPSDDGLFISLRMYRDTLLLNTDRYLISDYPISATQLTAIKAYRQALRDLPAQPGAPWDGGGELTPWPELPSVE